MPIQAEGSFLYGLWAQDGALLRCKLMSARNLLGDTLGFLTDRHWLTFTATYGATPFILLMNGFFAVFSGCCSGICWGARDNQGMACLPSIIK